MLKQILDKSFSQYIGLFSLIQKITRDVSYRGNLIPATLLADGMKCAVIPV